MIGGYGTAVVVVWLALWVFLTRNYGWRLDFSSGTVSLAITVVVTLLAAIGYLLGSRAKYQEFREFCRDVFPTGLLNEAANEKLLARARYFKECSEKVLLLQQYGASAFKNKHPKDYSPEDLRLSLERDFRNASNYFYDTYDTFRRLESMAYLTFKERDWKVYAGEPELKKADV